MIPKRAMRKLKHDMPSLVTSWNACRIYPLFTHVTAIKVMLLNGVYNITFLGGFLGEDYIVSVKSQEDVIDTITKFDFKLYRIMYSVFKDHATACKIALGEQ